jgi:membrane-associated protease RseP (regulator of RpoE activity)
LEQQNKIRVEVKYLFKVIPILIMIHTPFGLKFFDWAARTKAARIYAKSNRYLMPLITALMLFLLIASLMVMLSHPAIRETSRDLGPRSLLLIPGVNPYLPWTYALIALIITIIIHEAGHGIVARVYNVKIETTGIVLFFIVPVGAFVNIEQKELEKTPLKYKSSILTAGVLNNMIFAGVSFFGLYLVVSSLSPLPVSGGQEIGVSINGVNKGSLAEKIGLTEGSVIQTISNHAVRGNEDLRKSLQSNLGKTIEMTWYDKDKNLKGKNITLPLSVDSNKGILGVTLNMSDPRVVDPKLALDSYKNAFGTNPLAVLVPPTLPQGSTIPYSGLMADKYDSSIFGKSFPIVANMLFWLWFINFNVAVFNALPIGPLDGGQLYGSFIASRTKEKTGIAISSIITYIMVIIIFMSILLPYIL